jgi:hypothetical protein
VSSPRDVLCEARWCSQLGVPFWLWSWGYCDRPHGEGVANMEDTVTVRAKISPCFGAECVQEHWSTSTSEDNAGHLVILLGRHVIVGIIVVTRHGIMIQSPTTLLGSNRHCSARIHRNQPTNDQPTTGLLVCSLYGRCVCVRQSVCAYRFIWQVQVALTHPGLANLSDGA